MSQSKEFWVTYILRCVLCWITILALISILEVAVIAKVTSHVKFVNLSHAHEVREPDLPSGMDHPFSGFKFLKHFMTNGNLGKGNPTLCAGRKNGKVSLYIRIILPLEQPLFFFLNQTDQKSTLDIEGRSTSAVKNQNVDNYCIIHNRINEFDIFDSKIGSFANRRYQPHFLHYFPLSSINIGLDHYRKKYQETQRVHSKKLYPLGHVWQEYTNEQQSNQQNQARDNDAAHTYWGDLRQRLSARGFAVVFFGFVWHRYWRDRFMACLRISVGS